MAGASINLNVKKCLKELYPWLCIVLDSKKNEQKGSSDAHSIASDKTETSSDSNAA